MASDSGYTSEQLKKLEELFENYRFPNMEQREKWSKDLGIDPDQIKCWFKIKALLQKIEEKQQENNALRMENANIQLENLMMRRKLEDRPKCNTCSRSKALKDLLLENARLREEHQRVTNIVGILENPALVQLQGQVSKKDVVDLELRLAPTSSPTSITKDKYQKD